MEMSKLHMKVKLKNEMVKMIFWTKPICVRDKEQPIGVGLGGGVTIPPSSSELRSPLRSVTQCLVLLVDESLNFL